MKKFLLKIYYLLLTLKDNIIMKYNNITSKYITHPQIKTTDETLEKIIISKCSISRYGDAEFGLMNGENLKYQIFDKKLSNRLKQILKTNDENHIVCIPNSIINLEWATDICKNYWIKYLGINRKKIYKNLDIEKVYYDSLVTRLYMDIKDKSKVEVRFNKIKDFWYNREIVLIEGNQSRLGVGNDLFDNCKTLERIICPAINAFEKYDEILNYTKKYNKSKLILIALGPTATVLAYDLYRAGYQAIDIGNIDIEYEWFLKGVIEKCPVKNKYIGEIPGGETVDKINDNLYEKQIIKKFI